MPPLASGIRDGARDAAVPPPALSAPVAPLRQRQVDSELDSSELDDGDWKSTGHSGRGPCQAQMLASEAGSDPAKEHLLPGGTSARRIFEPVRRAAHGCRLEGRWPEGPGAWEQGGWAAAGMRGALGIWVHLPLSEQGDGRCLWHWQPHLARKQRQDRMAATPFLGNRDPACLARGRILPAGPLWSVCPFPTRRHYSSAFSRGRLSQGPFSRSVKGEGGDTCDKAGL